MTPNGPEACSHGTNGWMILLANKNSISSVLEKGVVCQPIVGLITPSGPRFRGRFFFQSLRIVDENTVCSMNSTDLK